MRNETLRDCFWILLAGAALAFLLRPFQDTPLIDDWTYAWGVERLLKHGQLRMLDWNIHINPVHVVWGWLFCLPAGFSFVALRLSTFVSALACVCGVYLLLRELEVTRRNALLGAAVLGLNPIFFFLAISFMTDVPFLALTVWAAWAMVRALRERSDGWLLAASALATLALGVRQVGVVMPVAMAMALLFHAESCGRRPWRVLVALLPLAFLGLLFWWKATCTAHLANLSDLKDAPMNKFSDLRYSLPLLPKMLVWDAAFTASALGVAMFPLAVACVRRELLWRAVIVFVVALASLAATVWWLKLAFTVPFGPGQTWAFGELGATEAFTANYTPRTAPAWALWTATVVAMGAFAVVAAACWRRLRVRGEAFVAWLTLGLFLLSAMLWLFYDRYVLPLVPCVTALLLAGQPALRLRAAVLALALFGIASCIGVRNHLAYNGAVWDAVKSLRDSGARVAEIDGGYVVNGWFQYAHPQDAPRDAKGAIVVPGMTTDFVSLRYKVANAPMSGWRRVRDFPYRRWLGRSGTIYALEQEPARQ